MAALKKPIARENFASGGPVRPGEIRIRRVYDLPPAAGTVRFLVDRLWPRGIKKSALSHTTWLPGVAPSPELRKWFGHEPSKWTEFRRRYRAELEKHPDSWKLLLTAAKKSGITLLYGARDITHNQAAVLKEFLDEK